MIDRAHADKLLQVLCVTQVRDMVATAFRLSEEVASAPGQKRDIRHRYDPGK